MLYIGRVCGEEDEEMKENSRRKKETVHLNMIKSHSNVPQALIKDASVLQLILTEDREIEQSKAQ